MKSIEIIKDVPGTPLKEGCLVPKADSYAAKSMVERGYAKYIDSKDEEVTEKPKSKRGRPKKED